MFGWKLIKETEIILQSEHVALQIAHAKLEATEAKKLIARLEKEVEYYRRKYDEALERADSQLDGILAQVGLPEVTATTKRERKVAEDRNEAELKKQQEEIAEIFAESVGQMEEYDALGLPSELREDAAKLMAGAKK